MNTSKKRSEILQEWERLYTEALIKTLNPVGDVLEIGFRNGLSTKSIHNFNPKSLTIIESNPDIFNDAKAWANQKKNARIIQGNWETALPSLATFDAILFNDFTFENDMAMVNFLFPEEILQASTEAKVVLDSLKEEMSQITMAFSDQDIEDFYQNIGQYKLERIPRFFKKLLENGNITKAQYEKALKKYHLEKGTQPALPQPDNMLQCLLVCLKDHMKKGSRFSFFLGTQVSKYEDSQFFDNVITNPDIDYKEATVTIKMSDKPRDALMPLVEKS